MSDDDESRSESDGEDLSTTGLIATRTKRSTAGNLYATIIQNLDDEELQKELLAEDEEDVGDYEGSDRDGDDDEVMDSSSDEEDGGPPKDGDKEDLEGEKELKRAERAEAKKRKRMEAAKLRIPGWQKRNKRVKLADGAKTEDGASERPKKKGDRTNWLLSDADAPTRQSSRSSAVQNRELTHASLKQFAERSEKQKQQSQRAQERENLKKRAELTQEERMAKAMEIEKETAREFGRWEREEAERQRIREEQLAAKRKRGIEGPVNKFWSGSVMWAGDKIHIDRVHKAPEDPKPEDVQDDHIVDDDGDLVMENASETKDMKIEDSLVHQAPQPPGPQEDSATAGQGPTIADGELESQMTQTQDDRPQPPNAVPDSQPPVATPRDDKPQTSNEIVGAEAACQSQGEKAQPSKELTSPGASFTQAQGDQATQAHEPTEAALLEGIHAFAAQPSTTSEMAGEIPKSSLQVPPAVPRSQPPPPVLAYYPSAPGLHADLCLNRERPIEESPYSKLDADPVPDVPLVLEHAQRTLLILEQYSGLEDEAPVVTRRNASKAAKEAAMLEPTRLASTLAPDAYPTFNPEEARYLTAKMRKRGAEQLLPLAPPKMKCAMTCWPARFRDPQTELPYADMQAYKLLQRILEGGCAWSGLLGAWVGPAYGQLGRPARGVPEGFGAPRPSSVESKPAPVKIESTS